MGDLLRQSWNEIADRPLAMLQCFWPLVLLQGAAIAVLYAGIFIEFEVLVGLAVASFLAVGPCAVRWHRHVIAAEAVDWVPRLPDMPATFYTAKLILLFFAFTIMQKIASGIAQLLVFPILGLLSGGEILPGMDFFVSAFAVVLSLSTFVLFLGPWMLRLPEGAIGSQAMTVRNIWQPGGKSSFLLALSVIYFVPAIFDLAVPLFVSSDVLDLRFFLAGGLSVFLNLLAAILALSLLTVTYRRQLDRAGMTFGRKSAIVV